MERRTFLERLLAAIGFAAAPPLTPPLTAGPEPSLDPLLASMGMVKKGAGFTCCAGAFDFPASSARRSDWGIDPAEEDDEEDDY